MKKKSLKPPPTLFLNPQLQSQDAETKKSPKVLRHLLLAGPLQPSEKSAKDSRLQLLILLYGNPAITS